MDQSAIANRSDCTFLEALANARCLRAPFDHWLIEKALPEAMIDAIANLPFEAPAAQTFDGRREANNSTRVYFTKQNQARFPACRDFVEAFNHPKVIAALEQTTGTDLARGRLRVEYCQDVDGFWLEPHVDIPVKLFTMLIYLSGEPELRDAGTDIYDASPEHNLVATTPYERNKGLIFIPGADTWHGFSPRPIKGVRRSLIVNYVSDAWRNVCELA